MIDIFRDIDWVSNNETYYEKKIIDITNTETPIEKKLAINDTTDSVYRFTNNFFKGDKCSFYNFKNIPKDDIKKQYDFLGTARIKELTSLDNIVLYDGLNLNENYFPAPSSSIDNKIKTY